MKKRLEEIERNILILFDEIREAIPTLHHIDFGITKYSHLSIPKVHGFVHTPEYKSYNSITEIIAIISKAEARIKREKILFQKFDKIL